VLRAVSEYGDARLQSDQIVFTAEKGFDEAFFRLVVDSPSREDDVFAKLFAKEDFMNPPSSTE
jgi:hypothetical protein